MAEQLGRTRSETRKLAAAKAVKRAKPEEPEEASNPPPKRHKTGGLTLLAKTSDNPSNTSSDENPDPAHSAQVEKYMAQQDKLAQGTYKEPKFTTRPEYPIRPDEALIQQYKDKAAQYERWMTDPKEKKCPVKISKLTYNYLTKNKNTKRNFQTNNNWLPVDRGYEKEAEEAGLPSAPNTWHAVYLNRGCHAPLTGLIFEQRITLGAIVADNIARYNDRVNKTGPYWSDVALAAYKYHHPIDTLRYVYFADVVNPSTAPLITDRLYRDAGLKVPEAGDRGVSDTIIWKPNEKNGGFEAILGSALGVAAASIVLGAWPRGTHRISAIRTWFFNADLNIRFDIEEIGAVGEASGSGSAAGGAKSAKKA
ncbi:hypothetical protein N7461_003446 [Penicillium sp. DV-2018c]|nr:hypothetical protein N7461_003446 [Penicillium sp. DV-2018c]